MSTHEVLMMARREHFKSKDGKLSVVTQARLDKALRELNERQAGESTDSILSRGAALDNCAFDVKIAS